MLISRKRKTVDTVAAVTDVSPYISAGLSERELSNKCAVHTASGETFPL